MRKSVRARNTDITLDNDERLHRGSVLRATPALPAVSNIHVLHGSLLSRGDNLVPVESVTYLPDDKDIIISLDNDRSLCVRRVSAFEVELRMDVAGDIVVLPMGPNVVRITDSRMMKGKLPR